MAKILIIEDDTNINNMVSEYLSGNGYACTQAFSGSEGSLRFSMEEFDLILLDLMLPGMTGEELIRMFAGKVPVIVLSAKNELDSKVELLTAGANDYICKPFDLKELLVRVQVQLRSLPASKLPDAQTELHYKDWILDPETREMTAAGQPVELTLHEFRILELLMKHPKKVFTKQLIYEYAWEEEYFVEDKTINVHISNIRSKLKLSGTDSYIQTVWGMGFKLS
ncbi:response regulator transcription factor [Blautia hominis]|uniref:Stage 0 sporulation protein A homolog n=1 Tax=Blautia hominis TaxID=2025493 RepID=A0ABQ0BHZ6_9FIRM